jgi:ribulose-phosphate 3-epimerase
MDGHFVPNITLGPDIVKALRPHVKIPFDVHLMIAPADPYLEAFREAGADIISVHPESGPHLNRTLKRIRQLGARVGVALSPGTSLDALEYIIEDVDLVLLMTVNPGDMGQPLVPQVLRKVEKLRSILYEANLNNVRISVDGNVNADTVPDMVAAGADNLVLGSSGLFRKDKGIQEMANEIRNAIDVGLKTRG